MKFGKRLAAEAARKWDSHYFDYKTIKKAIKDDIASEDQSGASFQGTLASELQKVSSFYTNKAKGLEELLSECQNIEAKQLAQLRSEIQELIKFVALNYVAVVKAIKKRNRRLQAKFGVDAPSNINALDLLGYEVFFTSPRLATLATHAEVMASAAAGAKPPGNEALEDFQCPVCLDVLHNPVVLTCAHRFCWGCLVAHITSSRAASLSFSKTEESDTEPLVPLRALADVAHSSLDGESGDGPQYYACPLCRKPHVLDIDSLQVDGVLSNFVEGLKASLVTATQESSAIAVADVSAGMSPTSAAPHAPCGCCHHASSAPPAPVKAPWSLVPPQLPQHKGRLTVLLDLDGTLVSSFTPKRAPRLPASVRTHVVGVGSKLNPAGVFVVERPGLREFLIQLAAIAEVVVFTAGLEEYASPIIDAIDPRGEFFASRIYREGTTRTDYYQCVKDMGRVDRALDRTLLVDDTPLAFLHQPDNGVPVLGFRGDPDDRLLLEAVLPLLQMLSKETSVQPVLRRRFEMHAWFARHGLPVDNIIREAKEALEREKLGLVEDKAAKPAAAAVAAAGLTMQASLPRAIPAPKDAAAAGKSSAPSPTAKKFLLLADFDKTLLDGDSAELLFERLAPELLPMLVGLDPSTNPVPITNSLLSELSRRGVSRDDIVRTISEIGSEISDPVVTLLSHAKTHGADVKIVADSNSLFVNHALSGKGLTGLVREVITNPSSFVRVENEAGTVMGLGNGKSAAVKSAGHKLLVMGRQGGSAGAHGCCRGCPENLCKGAEVRRIKAEGKYQRILYCGDGSSDVCALLALEPQDVVLARGGHPLGDFLSDSKKRRDVRCGVRVWRNHKELLSHAQDLIKH